jgi:RNA polymerase sigma-70 factor (ECF subfamily)
MNIVTNDRSPNATALPPLAAIPATPLARGACDSLSDDALVSRTRAGDVAALEELLGRHEEHLLRLVRRFVRDEHDAEEVLQDVFVTTWRKLRGFEERAQISSWLYRVAVNASLMHLRGRKRRPQCVDFVFGEHACEAANSQYDIGWGRRFRPDEQLESQELGGVLVRAIDRLPPSLGSVFDLREVQGRSTRQTARLLGISEVAVKARLHRARLALRDEMADYLVQ